MPEKPDDVKAQLTRDVLAWFGQGEPGFYMPVEQVDFVVQLLVKTDTTGSLENRFRQKPAIADLFGWMRTCVAAQRRGAPTAVLERVYRHWLSVPNPIGHHESPPVVDRSGHN